MNSQPVLPGYLPLSHGRARRHHHRHRRQGQPDDVLPFVPLVPSPRHAGPILTLLCRTVDDGSSQTLELTYEHNCLQVFQQAQRMAEAQKRAPPSTYAYGPSTVLKRTQPPPLPPAEHFPSVEVGDTVRVRARVKQWSANIHFVIGSDLGAPKHQDLSSSAYCR